MCIARLLRLLPVLLVLLALPTPGRAAVPLGGLAVAVSADGTQLIAGGDMRALYDIDPVTLQVKRRVHFGRPIVDMAFAQDGKTLAVESTSAVSIVDAKTLEPIKVHEKLEHLSVAPDAGLVAVRGRDHIHILSMADGTEKHKVKYNPMEGRPIFALSPDGKKLAFIGTGKTDENEPKLSYRDMPKELKGGAKSEWKQKHDGKSGYVRIFEIGKDAPLLDKKTFFSAPGSGRACWQGTSIVLVSYDNSNAVFDSTGEAKMFQLTNSYNYGSGFAPGGGVILSGGLRSGSRTTVPDLAGTQFKLDKLPGFPEYWKSFTFAADGVGFGGTSAYRVARIKIDGTIESTQPIY
ncbi:MAG: hypothetical protein GY946_23250 [bacterium]|nr:hypothetical protein [bacterium]